MVEVLTVIMMMAAIIFLGVFGEIIFTKTRIPDVLWLVILGIIIGPVFGIVSPDTLWVIAPLFSALALMIILFEGGLDLQIYKVIKEAPKGFLLAVTGFVLSIIGIMLVTEGLAFLGILQNWSLLNGLLLGAIVGGSSSLVVLPLAKKARLGGKLTDVLSIEAAATDALAVIVVFALIQFIVIPGTGFQEIANNIVGSFAIGAVIGAITGIMWLYVLRAFKGHRHHYMLTFAFLLLLYAMVDYIGGSAAIAILAFGLMLGNGKAISKMLQLSERISLDDDVKEFHSIISFFIKTFFFAFIGLMLVVELEIALIGIGLAVILLLIRIVSVKINTWKQDITANERHLMYSFMPRGLAAAVLAIMPLAYGIPGTEVFTGIAFTIIVTTIVICTVGVYVFTSKQPKEKITPKSKIEQISTKEGEEPKRFLKLGSGILKTVEKD
ncbi:MAG: cation:proton antiporter [archaeon]